jgi:hypothetical protein
MFEYFTHTPASAISISQRGLTSVTFGPHVQVGGFFGIDELGAKKK